MSMGSWLGCPVAHEGRTQATAKLGHGMCQGVLWASPDPSPSSDSYSRCYSEARQLPLSRFRSVALPMADVWTECVGKQTKRLPWALWSSWSCVSSIYVSISPRKLQRNRRFTNTTRLRFSLFLLWSEVTVQLPPRLSGRQVSPNYSDSLLVY